VTVIVDICGSIFKWLKNMKKFVLIVKQKLELINNFEN
jgi:hypothetical protein